MKALTRRNDIVINNRKMRVGDIISKLKNLPSHDVRDFFIKQKKSLPRKTRMAALRSVLDEQVRNQKVTSTFSDELNYRLNWYKDFSEYQYEALLESLSNSTLNLLYREELWLAILQAQDTLGIDNLAIFMLYNKSIAYDLNRDEEEPIMEFNKALDDIFIDEPGELDGLPVSKFRNTLKTSSTLVELRDIGTKYGVDVPRRIKKNELMDLIIAELAESGELDDELDKRIRKMPVMSLQRFAKDKGIKASIELKKEDIIEYIIDHVEISGYDASAIPADEQVIEENIVGIEDVQIDMIGDNAEQETPVIIKPSISGIEPLEEFGGIEAENMFADMDVADVFSGVMSTPDASPAASIPVLEVANEPEVFIDPTLFVDANTPFSVQPDTGMISDIPQVEIAVPEEPAVELDTTFQEVKDIDEYEAPAKKSSSGKKKIKFDESMLGGDLSEDGEAVDEATQPSKEVVTIKTEIQSLNERLAQLIEAQNNLLQKTVNGSATPNKSSKKVNDSQGLDIFAEIQNEQMLSEQIQELEAQKAREEKLLAKVKAPKLPKEPKVKVPKVKKNKNAEEEIPEEAVVAETDAPTEEELKGVDFLIAAAQKEVIIPPTKKELREKRREEEKIAREEANAIKKVEDEKNAVIRAEQRAKQKIANKKLAEEKRILRDIKNSQKKRRSVGKTIFLIIFLLFLLVFLLLVAYVIFFILYRNAIIPEDGIFGDIYKNLYEPFIKWAKSNFIHDVYMFFKNLIKFSWER